MSSFNCRERALLPWIFVALLLISLFLTLRTHAHAQQPASAPQSAPAGPAPAFDVAAIHLHDPRPNDYVTMGSSPGDGRLNAVNVSLFTLIWWSFEMPEARILGLPGWANTRRFDIEAAADPSVDAQLKGLSADAARKEKEQMVRKLLADRFGLVTHTETRELPIYNLVVAKGGPRLGAIRESGGSIGLSRGRLQVQSSDSVSTLAEQLSKVVGRDVIDKTGIAGRYDLQLHWTPDDAAAPTGESGSADSDPPLFTALEEQLGLKLEPAKGPVQVLVIDHVEMPTAN